jgi:outer membrane protein, multidrug efflux system
MRHALAAVTAAIFLSGCVAGPDYGGPPSMAAAAAFARASNEAATRDPPVDTWWSLLGDPVLDQLEAQALEGNLGVEAARARIAQARASVRQQQANRLPTIAGQATAVQANVPGLGLGSGSPSTGPTQGQDDHLSIYNLGLNANWELEFAGGQSRRVQLRRLRSAPRWRRSMTQRFNSPPRSPARTSACERRSNGCCWRMRNAISSNRLSR